MSIVSVQPLGIELEVAPDQTVMAAAAAAGYGWPTVCESNASCGTCVSIVEEGVENCGPMPADEEETLTRTLVPLDGQRRLACRLTVTGPVTLKKRGVHTAE
jgi:2Fe-2S ferredoxin